MEPTMEPTMFTAVSQHGPAISPHPEKANALVAVLFYDEASTLAEIQHYECPEIWRAVPVSDLEAWLETLLAGGIAHVIERFPPGLHSTMHDVAFWLTSLRALRAGRAYPEGEGASIVVDPE